MKEQEEKYSLQEGWVWTTLETICYKITDGSHNPPSKQEKGIPMLSARNIENYTINFDKDVRYISEEDYKNEKQRTNIEKGDVLLTIVGTIGRVSIVEQAKKFAIQRSVALLKPVMVSNKYLMYYLSSPIAQKTLIDNAKGTAQKGVYLSSLKDINVPITSLGEQNAIISQIDLLFSKLEEAESVLIKASTELKIYRQALLRNAFEGLLTKNWRKDLSIDAHQELTNIKIKREEKYNAEIENNRRKKIKIDFEFDYQRDNKISNWAISSLDNLININARIGWRGLTKKEYTHEGVFFLSVHSLNYGKNVVFKDASFISIERYEESPEIQLKENDILLCKDGAGIGKVGIIKILPNKATVNSSLLVIDAREVFNPDFLYYFFLGPDMQRLVNEKVSGSAIPHLFQKDIKKFKLKVPPRLEQDKIVEILESRFALVDNLEKTVDNVLNEIVALKHSILKKAFEGRLVNYSSDESVEELLNAIQEEKSIFLQSQKELNRNKPKQKKQMEAKKSILEILKKSDAPISAQELWEKSTSEGDIERFYSEIKDIYHQIDELKLKTESLLILKDEDK